ncbi:iron ABC transporter substrate-binding protein [Microbacterium sp. No. 7]|uniref:iron ABC transporter substrate-binding protein n=1 Tax=Microbacterium sp. No. 7 TaxID=1714373 RepID=UPI0006D11DC0|nr:iron ABC transporter substrate-binding protein [Microbacterium sp. No. 7]ALJ21027.1 iron ABC transporter substrate-binding protein [Microbacterium sp. No. 7]
MRKLRPRVALFSALAASALVLTACGSGGSGTPETAPATDTTTETEVSGERSLIVYSGRSESLVGPIIEQFEEASGITVKVRYANSIEMAAQLLEEGERTPAQVFLSQEAGALGALRDADLLVALPDDVTGAVDAHYNSSDDSWVALTGRARVVIYDSEKLSADQAPADVHELTKPEWSGRVGFAPTNASFQSFVTAMRVIEGEEAAEEWLRGLIANNAQTFPGNNPILEAVNTGALDVGLLNHYYWVGAAAEAGGPDAMRAQLQFGAPGTVSALVNVTGAGILTGSEDSEEALEFVRFLLSEQAQTYFVEETGEYSLLPGAPSPANVPTLDELDGPEIDYSKLADLEGTVELLQKVGLI